MGSANGDEEEWDSDFKPGPYVYDSSKEKPKAKGKGKGRLNRREVLGLEKMQGKKKRFQRRNDVHDPNPLLECFAKDLDLHSASEEESSEAAQTDEDSDTEDAQHDFDGDKEQAFTSKTLEGFTRQRSGTNANVPEASRMSAAPENDSVTGECVPKVPKATVFTKHTLEESDSDAETVLKRKHPATNDEMPRKKAKRSRSAANS
ncbi:hypothetical protein AX15_006861 [Amanita polypyramis BW_CC]|nr:hypothetical protein AX15_006861 [Amanita polypyramis BW_CC]